MGLRASDLSTVLAHHTFIEKVYKCKFVATTALGVGDGFGRLFHNATHYP